MCAHFHVKPPSPRRFPVVRYRCPRAGLPESSPVSRRRRCSTPRSVLYRGKGDAPIPATRTSSRLEKGSGQPSGVHNVGRERVACLCREVVKRATGNLLVDDCNVSPGMLSLDQLHLLECVVAAPGREGVLDRGLGIRRSESTSGAAPIVRYQPGNVFSLGKATGIVRNPARSDLMNPVTRPSISNRQKLDASSL